MHVQIKLSYLLQAIELPPVVASTKMEEISKLRYSSKQQMSSQNQNQNQLCNNQTIHNSTSMLDLFGPSSTTSFSSSFSNQSKNIFHSQSTSNFSSNISDSFFGLTNSTLSPKNEKTR